MSSVTHTGVTTGTARQGAWPLERVLFLLAGTMTLLSVLLAIAVSPWFLLLTAFVGVNQLAFVGFGNCPSSWLLRRYAGLRGAGER
jgi:hypothetical protein